MDGWRCPEIRQRLIPDLLQHLQLCWVARAGLRTSLLRLRQLCQPRRPRTVATGSMRYITAVEAVAAAGFKVSTVVEAVAEVVIEATVEAKVVDTAVVEATGVIEGMAGIVEEAEGAEVRVVSEDVVMLPRRSFSWGIRPDPARLRLHSVPNPQYLRPSTRPSDANGLFPYFALSSDYRALDLATAACAWYSCFSSWLSRSWGKSKWRVF